MGSITDAIMIPFGSVDIALAGIIDSITFTIASVNNVIGDALNFIGS